MDSLAEVSQLHCSILSHEKVCRLDIQMDKVFLMHVANRTCHISKDAPDFFLWQQNTTCETRIQLFLVGLIIIVSTAEYAVI